MVTLQWHTYPVFGSAMFRVSRKLKLLKKDIREFSKGNYSGIEKRTKEAHEALCSAQNLMLLSPSITNAEAELEAMQKWIALSQAEEAFFLQRSRVQWTVLGDSGTRFFHKMVETRRASNHIHFLTDDLGVRYESQDGIEQHCIGYFKDLLGKPIAPPLFVQSDLDLLYGFYCSTEDSEKFTMRFTAEEIKAAFFSLPKNKTCGPDGFSPEFFTGCWSVVGPEITEAVLEFFS